MKRLARVLVAAGWCALGVVSAGGQGGELQTPLNTAGQVLVDGHPTAYLIRHLPVSSFPVLPARVQSLLNQRGCLIPQTYQAHEPENVIQASLERRGSTDWAVLCSVHGTVSLMVIFGDSETVPHVLASAPETERLQPHGMRGVLGFDWGIDRASPQQVHDAQAGMRRRPPLLDHDALAESIINQATVYHYYSGNAWKVLDTQD